MPETQRLTGLSAPTVSERFKTLEGLGIVREVSGRKQNRMYAYREYLDILNEGMEI